MVRTILTLFLLSVPLFSLAQNSRFQKLVEEKSFNGIKLGTHRSEIPDLKFEWSGGSIVNYDLIKINPLFKKIKPIKVTYGFIDDFLWSVTIKVYEEDFQKILNKLIKLYGEPQVQLSGGPKCGYDRSSTYLYKFWESEEVIISYNATTEGTSIEDTVRTFYFGMNPYFLKNAYYNYINKDQIEQYYLELEKQAKPPKRD